MSIGKTDNMSTSVTPFHVRILVIFMLSISITQCKSLANTPEVVASQIPFSENAVQEVAKVITSFETLWLNEDAHRNPAIQANLATGKYLEYYGYARSNIQDEPFWLVTESAKLESIQILEYDPNHFKAKACITHNISKILPDGTLVETLHHPNVALCGVYVFVKIENTWKLLGYINAMDPRTLEHAPAWLKDIIGDVP